MLIYSIKIDGLVKFFDNVKALSGLTVDFGPGLLHGIIGPDGAGKTTLLRMLAGLLHPSSGSIQYFSGEHIVQFNELRPFIGYMPSSTSLYHDLTVEEHLDFFRNMYRLGRREFLDRSRELLRMTRMEEFRSRKAGQLSGGMYKKLGLMCVLLQSPAVLLLDEPTSGVDPISRREFWEMLYGFAGSILIIVSTAYMDEAERCTRVHFLEEGKLLKSGNPYKILEEEGIKSFEEIFMPASRK